MVCSACGWEQAPGAQFCKRCGASLSFVGNTQQQSWMPITKRSPYEAGVPAGARLASSEASMRVQQHLQPLGITWILFGAYRLVFGLVAAVTLHTLASGGVFDSTPQFALKLIDSLFPVIAAVTGLTAVAAIAAGYGLLTQKPWARTLTMILAILALIKIPFGTALGIYTLWVLAPRSSSIEWERIQKTH